MLNSFIYSHCPDRSPGKMVNLLGVWLYFNSWHSPLGMAEARVFYSCLLPYFTEWLRLEGPLEVILSTLLLKQGHLKSAAQDHVQTASEYLQGRRLHNSSGQPVSVLSHLHNKKNFPDVQMAPPVSQFVPILSGPGTGHHGKEPGSDFFTTSLRVFISCDKSLLLSWLNSPSSQPLLIGDMLQSLNHLRGPSLDFLQ